MMHISKDEQDAIRRVLAAGAVHGYGNMISHLKTAWAKSLMEKWDMDEKSARITSGGDGYPFVMQDDLVIRGEWDETGERYRKPGRKRKAKA